MRPDGSAFHVPVAIQRLYPPDRDALFRLLGGQMTDSLLLQIAAADYGIQAEKHFAALKRLIRRPYRKTYLPWHPGEVLSLTRWTEVEDGAYSSHLIRAFCSCALREPPQIPGSVFGEYTFNHLLTSCLALGPVYQAALGQMIVWSLGNMETGDLLIAHEAVGLLVVAAYGSRDEDRSAFVIAQWVRTLMSELHTDSMQDRLFGQEEPETWPKVVADLQERFAPGELIESYLELIDVASDDDVQQDT